MRVSILASGVSGCRVCFFGECRQDGQVDLRVVVPLEQDADSTVCKDGNVTVGRCVGEDNSRVRPSLSVIVAHAQHEEVSPFPGRVREENNPGLIAF